MVTTKTDSQRKQEVLLQPFPSKKRRRRRRKKKRRKKPKLLVVVQLPPADHQEQFQQQLHLLRFAHLQVAIAASPSESKALRLYD